MSAIKNVLSKYYFAVLLAILVLGVLAWIVFGPLTDTRALNNELKPLESKYSALKAKAVDKEVLQQELSDAQAELANYELTFPPAIEQESTLRIVQSLEQKSGFTVTAMSYEKLQYDTLNQPAQQEIAGSTVPIPTGEGAAPPVPGKGMKIPIRTQFTANYAELKQFVTQIHQTKQRIGLREIQMSTDKNNTIKGSLILEFYGFMPE